MHLFLVMKTWNNLNSVTIKVYVLHQLHYLLAHFQPNQTRNQKILLGHGRKNMEKETIN